MADQLLPVAPVSCQPLRVGGVTLDLSPSVEIVSLGVFASAGRHEFFDRIHREFGVVLPERPGAVRAADGRCTFLWTAPDQWLAVADGGASLFSRLQETCGGLCALTSQGDSRTILSLSGPGARDVASRLLPIDLHPRAFGGNDVASTLAGHIPVIVWLADETPTCLFLVFRSFATSLFHDISVALAAFSSSEKDLRV